MPTKLPTSTATSESEIQTTYDRNIVHYTDLLPFSAPSTSTDDIPSTVISNDYLLSNSTESVSSQHLTELHSIQPSVKSSELAFKVPSYYLLVSSIKYYNY